MIKIGLTGGIGAGKTEITKIFKILGIPVYYSDLQSKIIINSDLDIINKLKSRFGDNIYINNHLDSKKLGEIVFNSSNELDYLNKIIHPAVEKDFDDWIKIQNSKYVIKEAAILFESGTYKKLDKIISVISTSEIRIKRVIKRDKVSKNVVIQRINKQISDVEKIKLSDYLIYNNEKVLVVPQVMEIHQQIINL